MSDRALLTTTTKGSPAMKLTKRGEIVLATIGTFLLLAMLGIAGWIEGGMN